MGTTCSFRYLLKISAIPRVLIDRSGDRGYTTRCCVAGAVAVYAAVGALYVIPKLSQSTFNGIWRTRLLVQITAFLLAVRSAVRARSCCT